MANDKQDMSLTKMVDELKQNFGDDFIIHSKRPLSGGSINEVYHLKTNYGEFCIKVNDPSRYPEMFEKEASGIRLLLENSDFTLPEICSVTTNKSDSYLVMSYIDEASPSSTFWETFGQQLAHLHQSTSDAFGLDHDNYIGSLRQDNKVTKEWTTFFVERRILPQVDAAVNSGLISTRDMEKFDRLFEKLESIFPNEPPALLHGDLWSGNYMVDQLGNPALIDPAVYYGNREMDLAMTFLFGGFDPKLYSSYHEVFPLEPGWRDRMELCNLYPLLVHVNLFGASYVAQVQRVLDRYT